MHPATPPCPFCLARRGYIQTLMETYCAACHRRMLSATVIVMLVGFGWKDDEESILTFVEREGGPHARKLLEDRFPSLQGTAWDEAVSRR